MTKTELLTYKLPGFNRKLRRKWRDLDVTLAPFLFGVGGDGRVLLLFK